MVSCLVLLKVDQDMRLAHLNSAIREKGKSFFQNRTPHFEFAGPAGVLIGVWLRMKVKPGRWVRAVTRQLGSKTVFCIGGNVLSWTRRKAVCGEAKRRAFWRKRLKRIGILSGNP